MEVTNVLDRVTHAVISPGKVESFEVSDSAEFFHIISDALYSDKPLAVVREVLCNAWDAHIEAGIIGTAVDITLTDQKLIIRDYGSGIPPSMIKKIYGTYGNSTKTHDGNQTGGFGLGSKAPFAYADHFEVTSYCYGDKTIYNMAKSSAVVGGKPSITTLVTVPTDDSGLQVSINLKHRTDQQRFETLIRQIVMLGEMRVKLNGVLLKTVPFSEASYGFMFVNKDLVSQKSSASIFVRYGNVVYPIEENEMYEAAYGQARKFLSTVGRNRHAYGYDRNDTGDWCLVLQAAPHSMSVTPSRESLSLTDRTIETIQKLLANFLDQGISVKLEKRCLEITKEGIEATFLVGKPADLIMGEVKKFPQPKILGDKDPNYLVNIDNISRMFLRHTYPDWSGYRRRDMLMRLDALITSNFGKKGLARSLKLELLRGKSLDNSSDWFHREVLWPALKVVKRVPELSERGLYVYVHERAGYNSATGRHSQGGDALIAPKNFRKKTLQEYLPFIRGIVIVAYNRTDVFDRASSFPVIKNWMGNPIDSLAYIVPRTSKRGELAVEAFKKAGYTVLDLTVRQPWEPAWATEPVSDPKPKRKKAKGLPKASQLLQSGKLVTNIVYPDYDLMEGDKGPEMIENPEVIFKIGRKENVEGIDPLGLRSSIAAVRLFGEKGGCASNSIQEAKAIAAGAMQLQPYVLSKLLEEFKTNPKIEEHFRNYSVEGLNHLGRELLKVVRVDAPLRAHFKLPNPVEQRERDFLAINKHQWPGTYYRKKYPELTEIDKLIETWTPSAELQAFTKIADEATLLRILDLDDVKTILVGGFGSYPDVQKKAVREALLRIIKG